MKYQDSEVRTKAQFPLRWPKIAGWARKVNWVQLHFWKLKELTQKSEETAFIWD